MEHLLVFDVSSTSVYIEQLVVTHASKIQLWWMKKSKDSDAVSEVKYRNGNSVASQLYIL